MVRKRTDPFAPAAERFAAKVEIAGGRVCVQCKRERDARSARARRAAA